MHITQIHRDYDGGLRLMIGLAVDNMGPEFVTGRVVNGHIDLVPERVSYEAQIREMKRLAQLNSKWMQIAYSPAEAREIILHNKLALVIGIEPDQLGTYGFASPGEEVAYLWNLGARTILPVHAINNKVGGPAIGFAAYNWLNDLLHRPKIDATPSDLRRMPPEFFKVSDNQGCTAGPGECVMFKLAESQLRVDIQRTIFSLFHLAPWIPSVNDPDYKNTGGQKNVQGLCDFGKDYIAALMRKGMIIDTAHMSDQSVADTFGVIGTQLVGAHPDCPPLVFGSTPQPCDQYAYPAIVSHAHFRAQAIHSANEPIIDYTPKEYDISESNLAMVERVGGVVGPFVGEERIEKSNIKGWRNDCWMSSKTFAFSFQYALDKLRTGVGMATDLIPYRMGQRTYTFNTDGLAHIGLIPDMLQDLKNLDLPAEDWRVMFSSAEAYLQMWERVERVSKEVSARRN
jgi:hypothetical protein